MNKRNLKRLSEFKASSNFSLYVKYQEKQGLRAKKKLVTPNFSFFLLAHNLAGNKPCTKENQSGLLNVELVPFPEDSLSDTRLRNNEIGLRKYLIDINQ